MQLGRPDSGGAAPAFVGSPLPAELMVRLRRDGFVSEQSIGRLLPRAARRWPHRRALAEGARVLTYGELWSAVRALAGLLRSSGVAAGDRVCWQAPNWWEAHVAALAVWHVGAVNCPIPMLNRELELRQILHELQPSAVIAPGVVRGFDHADAFDQICDEEAIETRIKLGLRHERSGWASFADAFQSPADDIGRDIGVEDPCLILYTSGTSSGPKGVMLSPRSVLSEGHQIAREWNVGRTDVTYMPAPLGHVTGVGLGIVLPLLVGGCSVLSERWEPELAVREIDAHGVTISAGATVFLRELAEAAAGRAPLSLREYACGGAAVPIEVMNAAEAVGIRAHRCYGMTENSSVTLASSLEPYERRARTDGRLAEGVEAFTIDSAGNRLPPGEVGEIVVRGPERMLGYVDAAQSAAALDAEGWFRTGDLGSFDAGGYLTVLGRLKDIINRGGEKFATADIEALILDAPGVAGAAVIPAPDARFGEVPAAFVVGSATTESLVRHLLDAGIAKQKIPVHWRFVDSLPSTPSGKVKKHELRMWLDRERR